MAIEDKKLLCDHEVLREKPTLLPPWWVSHPTTNLSPVECNKVTPAAVLYNWVSDHEVVVMGRIAIFIYCFCFPSVLLIKYLYLLPISQ